MLSVSRGGLLIGGLCLLVLFTVPAIATDVQHEHPEEVDGEDDLEGVERWLGDRIGKIHVDCAEGIRLGSFDACEDLDRDGQYAELLDRYATVENDLESDSETADRFNETREQQREYAALREEFETTYAEYRAARAAGNDAEARELARELRRLADQIAALGEELEVRFVELDQVTTANLSTASESINRSTTDVRRITLEAELESFEKAEINATASETASFLQSGTVSGRVTAQNGSAIAGAEVVLSDGTQSFVTRTDQNGSYELAYRPTRTPAGETNLTIRYRPAPTDPYLGAKTNATTDVRAVDSTLRIENHSSEVAFGDQLIVTGTVRANNASVPDVDVSIYADSEQLARTRTDVDGSFQAVTRVSPTLTLGTESIEARASEPAQAIRPSRAMVEFTVLETPTELDVAATAADGEFDVTGRLRTDAETPIKNRPISVRIGGDTYEVRTDSDGQYRLTIDHEANSTVRSDADSTVETVTATYNETGVNLGSSRAETTIEYTSGAGEAVSTSFVSAILSAVRNAPAQIALVALLSVLGVSSALYLWRSRDAESVTSASRTESMNTNAVDTDDATATPVNDLLAIASEKLAADPQGAVYASYAAVRSLFDANADQTHWELYERQRSDEDNQSEDDLYIVTNLFEQAAFAADDIDPSQAKSALRATERYLEAMDGRGK